MERTYYFLCVALDVCMVGNCAWRHDTAMAVFFGVLACGIAAMLAFDAKR